MKYLLLDNFNGNVNIILDEIGDTLVFDNIESAQGALEEECQNGTVIPLDVDVITLLNDCRNLLYNLETSPARIINIVNKLDNILGHKQKENDT